MKDVIGPSTLSQNEAVAFAQSPDDVRSWVSYPEPFPRRLEAALAELNDLAPASVLATAGASGALAQLFRAFVRPGDVVALPTPSFPLYDALVSWSGATALPLPFAADWSYDAARLLHPAVLDARLVLLCAPNNPTGVPLPSELLARLAASAAGVIAVDEAYAEYAGTAPGTDAVSAGAERVVAVRSLSKAWGGAALRVGAAFACPALIESLRRTTMPYSLPQGSVDAALRLLSGEGEVGRRVAHNSRERSRVRAALLALGCEVPQSGGNFLCLVEPSAGTEIATALLERFPHRVMSQGLADGRMLLRLTLGSAEQSDEALRLVKAARFQETEPQSAWAFDMQQQEESGPGRSRVVT